MEPLESSLKSLVTRVLEKTAPEAAREFRKRGDRIVHECLATAPEALRKRVQEAAPPPPKKTVRTRGGAAVLGLEVISVGITMTSIVVHLWHERTLLKLAREERSACQKLKSVWGGLLVKHGFTPDQARQIAAEFGEDLQEVFLREPVDPQIH